MYNLVKKVKEDSWTGRIDHVEDRASFRYHQIVELIQIESLDSKRESRVSICFGGDEGVRRNKGQ